MENQFAQFFNAPSALLFNSGWDANVSFFATVPQRGDWIIYDELVHASVHSGMRGSRVPPSHRIAIKHNDPQALQDALRSLAAAPSSSSSSARGNGGGTIFLALESLYSMDGDFAPLTEMLDVFDRHVKRERQCVVLDEAHSTGVYGDGGRGIVHASKEEGRVGVRLMTFGKAVGCSGGRFSSVPTHHHRCCSLPHFSPWHSSKRHCNPRFEKSSPASRLMMGDDQPADVVVAVLLASPTIRSFLVNFARPFIFSTAIPHSTLISLRCAWEVLQSSEGDKVCTNPSKSLATPVLQSSISSRIH